MDAVKWHLATTILVTQAVALYDGRLPYFPIEVSQTAASSSSSLGAFTTGIASLLVTLIYTESLTDVTLALWVGLMVVALVPGTLSWSVHMLGVAIVFLAAGVHVYRAMAKEPSKWIPLAWAILLFSLRVVIRSMVIWSIHPPSPTWYSSLEMLVQRTRAVMELGPLAFEPSLRARLWPWIGPTLKLCGVLQWVAFFALSLVF